MVFDRKVEIDELEELEDKQAADVASVLHIDDQKELEPTLLAIDLAPDAPVHVADPNAQPEWVSNLALAEHYTEETLAEELVKQVHDLMADDVAALVHDHVVADDANEDHYEGLTPDFFADSAVDIGTNDEHPVDGTFVVSSAHRNFLEEDSLYGGGGGGGGPPPPPSGDGEPDSPPEEPPPGDPKARKADDKAAPKATDKPTTEPAATPAKPTKPGKSKARGDDQG
jgi:hypothetical protein